MERAGAIAGTPGELEGEGGDSPPGPGWKKEPCSRANRLHPSPVRARLKELMVAGCLSGLAQFEIRPLDRVPGFTITLRIATAHSPSQIGAGADLRLAQGAAVPERLLSARTFTVAVSASTSRASACAFPICDGPGYSVQPGRCLMKPVMWAIRGGYMAASLVYPCAFWRRRFRRDGPVMRVDEAGSEPTPRLICQMAPAPSRRRPGGRAPA